MSSASTEMTLSASPASVTPQRTLHVVDYVFFALLLLGTLIIGVYHAVRSRQTTSDFLVGGRTLSTLPVSISLMASFVSAILMLGFPAEVYVSGSRYWGYCFGIGFGAILAVTIFVPVLYPLKLTSVNEYLRMRFKSRLMVILGCLSSVSIMVLYTGTVYYAPATAIEAVSGFPTWASIFIASGITIIYTTIGGFKAVVWTDVFQAAIMLVGLVVVTIKGALNVGGIGEVWRQNGQWGHLNFIEWSPDPTIKYTLWSLTLGVAFNFLTIYGSTQTSVQRYSSLPTLTKATLCVFGVVPGTLVMTSLACLSGMVIFAFYAYLGCDPLRAGYLDNSNQLVPHFIMDTLNFPGLPGLFMAALCAASLSSASSALNSAAANVWEDILKETFPDLSDRTSLLVTKALVVMFGVASTGLAFAVSLLGGTVIQSILTFASVAGGPTSALFLLGLTFPFVNWKGAITGGVISFALTLWVAFGSYSIIKHEVALPSPTSNCSSYVERYLPHLLVVETGNMTSTSSSSSTQPWFTTLHYTQPTTVPTHEESGLPGGLYSLYSLSYLWLSPFSISITMVIGVIVSLMTGGMGDEEVDASLLHPLVRRCTGRTCKVGVQEVVDKAQEGTENSHGQNNSSTIKAATEETGEDNPAFEPDAISPYYPTMFESSV